MFTRRCWSYITLFSPTLLLFTLIFFFTFASTAEIGYGPLFDPCGDNCQTQMVQFCTVGRDLAQMTDCWCKEAETGEYIGKMEACLSSCDQAVSDRSVQRDQMVRYRKVVCEGQSGKTVVTDTLFAEYWRTRFWSRGKGFVPAVTRGIPPPTAEHAVGITISGSGGVSTSDAISPPTGIPETSGTYENGNSSISSSLTPPPVIPTLSLSSSSSFFSSSSSITIPAASSNLTTITRATPTLAPSVISPLATKSSTLTTGQLIAVIVICILGLSFVALSIVFFRRWRASTEPFAFLPTRPCPRPRPRINTATRQQSWWARNIEAAPNSPQSPLSSILPRYYRPKLPLPIPPSGSVQQTSPSQTHARTIVLTPPSPSTRSSSTRILTSLTTTQSRSRDRVSEHTIIEPQPQEVITEVSTATRLSVACSQCDYCSASCSSWSESWIENDDRVR